MHQEGKTQKILITGATGLLGTNLIHELTRGDNNPFIVGIGNKNDLPLEFLKGRFFRFDLTQPYHAYDKLSPYGDEFVWIHAASAISGATFDAFDKINVEGTKKLVKKAEELHVSRFILISSMSVYGPNHPPNVDEVYPENPMSKYGKSKLKQEQIVKNSNIDWTIIRPSYIGGPYDKNFLEEIFTRVKTKSMPFTSKRGKIAYVDARDLARGIIGVLSTETTIGQVYNIQSSGIYLDEFVDQLGKSINENPPFGREYPYWLLMAVGTLMEIWGLISRKSTSRRISRYRIKTLTSDHTMDTTKASKHFQFQPKYDIKTSIRDWLEWRINNKETGLKE